ncbi:sigma-70 family RNA polymerase sigma factor [Acidisoma cellulosilytica]|uniref:Sigma-70 family RNA polymerase sigma factor n=1 Tax=Acidisoma cellulosilyticum TaxID=2802395 RepID=A0A963YYP1_9PROT|nr:sigma-70 family RNA polymerase sigma factor [Acidisoma cellulosilyticum]MCB8879688.1 sigma-70 family RNA polymerase sigma factor [Acidisoma cellulosilyticum]
MSEAVPDPAASFLPVRPALIGLGYRMTGSWATAEDIAQDVYLRWQATDRAIVALPRAWLMKAAARLALDHLKSARVRREDYVGPWLPEPVLDSEAAPQEAAWARSETLSLAFMLVLERLSPPERAIFILHDLFDTNFGEIAGLLGRSEATCRQIAVRARAKLGDAAPRHGLAATESDSLTQAFFAATQSGDEAMLRHLLARDVVVHTDGGGIRPAALKLIYGDDKAARMFAALARKRAGAARSMLFAGLINGEPGYVTLEPDGLPQVTVLTIADDRIAAIYIIRNPEKLRAIADQLGLSLT